MAAPEAGQFPDQRRPDHRPFLALLVQDGQKANLRNALELLAAGLMASRGGGEALLRNPFVDSSLLKMNREKKR